LNLSHPGLRRALWIGATLVFTGAVLEVLIHDFGGRDLVAAARGANPAWIGVAFGMASACVGLGALRWQLVLAAMGYEVGFWKLLVAILATWPPGVVVPSRANEVLRAVAIRRAVPMAEGTGSIVAEKLIDLLVLLLIAAAGAWLRALWVAGALLGAAAALEVAVVTVVGKKRSQISGLAWVQARAGASRALERLFAASDVLVRRPARLAVVSLVSLVIRVLTIGIGHALLVAVGAGVPVFDTLTLWPVAILAGLLPVTLGGLGTRDAALIYLLRTVAGHAAGANVLAATIGYSAVAMWSFAIVGLPFMVSAAVGTPAEGDALAARRG
jgi:glycosyltransferase 2 family protein